MPQIVDARARPAPPPSSWPRRSWPPGKFLYLPGGQPHGGGEPEAPGRQPGFDAAVTEGEGEFSLAFTRAGCQACEEAVSAPLPAPGADWAVFVGRDIIGDGDRELGANLMRCSSTP